METYDPKEVTVIVAGNVLTGFAEERVRVARLNNQVEDQVGSDGEVVRFLTNDRRGTIQLSLLPTSPSNLFLSSLANADEVSGASVFAASVQDNRGNDLHVGAEAWIEKQPEAVYLKGVEARVWMIKCADLRMIHGGY